MRWRWPLLLVPLLLTPALALAARRPAPLPDEDGCEHYKGTSSGNDPSVRLDVILCPHADGTEGKVSGKLTWSSTVSGWNLRQLEGQWKGDQLKMKDLKILEEKPAGGFYFCTVDTYTLDRRPDGTLKGKYDSEACRDHATMTLVPVEAAPGGQPGSEATGEAPATPEPPADPEAPQAPEAAEVEDPPMPTTRERPPTEEAARGCGCAVTPMLAFPLLGLRRRRRRPNL